MSTETASPQKPKRKRLRRLSGKKILLFCSFYERVSEKNDSVAERVVVKRSKKDHTKADVQKQARNDWTYLLEHADRLLLIEHLLPATGVALRIPSEARSKIVERLTIWRSKTAWLSDRVVAAISQLKSAQESAWELKFQQDEKRKEVKAEIKSLVGSLQELLDRKQSVFFDCALFPATVISRHENYAINTEYLPINKQVVPKFQLLGVGYDGKVPYVDLRTTYRFQWQSEHPVWCPRLTEAVVRHTAGYQTVSRSMTAEPDERWRLLVREEDLAMLGQSTEPKGALLRCSQDELRRPLCRIAIIEVVLCMPLDLVELISLYLAE